MSPDKFLEALYLAVADVRPDLDPAVLTPSASLRELGLNSMERAEVIMLAMSDLGVRVPMTAFAQASDLGGLAAAMESRA